MKCARLVKVLSAYNSQRLARKALMQSCREALPKPWACLKELRGKWGARAPEATRSFLVGSPKALLFLPRRRREQVWGRATAAAPPHSWRPARSAETASPLGLLALSRKGRVFCYFGNLEPRPAVFAQAVGGVSGSRRLRSPQVSSAIKAGAPRLID